MNDNERLNRVFTEEFITKNKNIDNIDDLYDAVLAVDPEISRESYDAYVSKLSKAMHNEGELNEDDLEDVAGGAIDWAVVGGVAALLGLCYKGGEAIGKGIYYLTHRK